MIHIIIVKWYYSYCDCVKFWSYCPPLVKTIASSV